MTIAPLPEITVLTESGQLKPGAWTTGELVETIVTFTDHSVAGQSAEVAYYDARSVVDGAKYPALAAVWENDDDRNAFANL